MKTNYIPQITLTPHFSLYEFLQSDYIEVNNDDDLRRQQCNVSCFQIFNMFNLCYYVLEPARQAINNCIVINSGYRCVSLNTAIGGVQGSQHCLGMAADIRCSNNKRLFEFIKDNLSFDQLICYGAKENPTFIHVSFKSFKANRKQVIYK